MNTQNHRLEPRIKSEARSQLDAKARELIAWLNDNLHPYASITITTTGYSVGEGIHGSGPIHDYVKD